MWEAALLVIITGLRSYGTPMRPPRLRGDFEELMRLPSSTLTSHHRLRAGRIPCTMVSRFHKKRVYEIIFNGCRGV